MESTELSMEPKRLDLPEPPKGFFWKVQFAFDPSDGRDWLSVELRLDPWATSGDGSGRDHWTHGLSFERNVPWTSGPVASEETLTEFREMAERLGQLVFEEFEIVRKYREPLHHMLGIYVPKETA